VLGEPHDHGSPAGRPAAYGAKQPNPGLPAGTTPSRSFPRRSGRTCGRSRSPCGAPPTPGTPLRTSGCGRDPADAHRGTGQVPHPPAEPGYATTVQKCGSGGHVRPDLRESGAAERRQQGTAGSQRQATRSCGSLAFTQPARWAARYGIVVTATPGATRPNSWGLRHPGTPGRPPAGPRETGRAVQDGAPGATGSSISASSVAPARCCAEPSESGREQSQCEP
jgi:hypothetical protein